MAVWSEHTTANYPNVMLAGYAYSKYTVIYLIFYVIIIIIILLPTILAVVYQAYHTQTQLQFTTIKKLQSEALYQAFDVLTCNQSNTISLTLWIELMKQVRPDLNLQGAQVLIPTLRLDGNLCCNSPIESQHILLNETHAGWTLNQCLNMLTLGLL